MLIPLISLLAFLISAFLLPFTMVFLLRKFGNFKDVDGKFLIYFPAVISIFSLLANFVWNNLIFGHVYYEWDNLFSFRYTPFFKDSPVTSLSYFTISRGQVYQGSWLASGWSLFSLSLIWIMFTIIVYVVSISSLYIMNRNKTIKNVKFIKRLTIIWLLLSIMNGFLNVTGFAVTALFYWPLLFV